MCVNVYTLHLYILTNHNTVACTICDCHCLLDNLLAHPAGILTTAFHYDNLRWLLQIDPLHPTSAYLIRYFRDSVNRCWFECDIYMQPSSLACCWLAAIAFLLPATNDCNRWLPVDETLPLQINVVAIGVPLELAFNTRHRQPRDLNTKRQLWMVWYDSNGLYFQVNRLTKSSLSCKYKNESES